MEMCFAEESSAVEASRRRTLGLWVCIVSSPSEPCSEISWPVIQLQDHCADCQGSSFAYMYRQDH